MKIPIAQEKDYRAIQGGVPEIAVDGNLTTITHNYSGGGGVIVTSHIDHGTVILTTPEGPKEFKTDFLKRFHGQPCEKASLAVGGEGYPRTQ